MNDRPSTMANFGRDRVGSRLCTVRSTSHSIADVAARCEGVASLCSREFTVELSRVSRLDEDDADARHSLCAAPLALYSVARAQVAQLASAIRAACRSRSYTRRIALDAGASSRTVCTRDV